DKYNVTGTLTMRGVSKKVTLPVTYTGEVKDPWGNTKAGFETSTTLNRKDYGIVWNQAVDNGGVILGDDVTIEINLETQKQAPKAATK
ncbi:MAG TPA: YceI family protein, partial [Thermoanaerobaculia bacterium]|nr:YceI family protein [Thermoanaerobaculia bacterium]